MLYTRIRKSPYYHALRQHGCAGTASTTTPTTRATTDLELDGMRMCMSQTGYTGELGYQIYLIRR